MLTPGELVSPIAKNSGDWEFRNALYHSDNVYFIAHVREFEVTLDGLTPEEKTVHFDWRWWSLDDLDGATVRIVPPGLADAIRTIRATGTPREPLELPYEE
jgi:hypothetical protein